MLHFTIGFWPSFPGKRIWFSHDALSLKTRGSQDGEIGFRVARRFIKESL